MGQRESKALIFQDSSFFPSWSVMTPTASLPAAREEHVAALPHLTFFLYLLFISIVRLQVE